MVQVLRPATCVGDQGGVWILTSALFTADCCGLRGRTSSWKVSVPVCFSLCPIMTSEYMHLFGKKLHCGKVGVDSASQCRQYQYALTCGASSPSWHLCGPSWHLCGLLQWPAHLQTQRGLSGHLMWPDVGVLQPLASIWHCCPKLCLPAR